MLEPITERDVAPPRLTEARDERARIRQENRARWTTVWAVGATSALVAIAAAEWIHGNVHTATASALPALSTLSTACSATPASSGLPSPAPPPTTGLTGVPPVTEIPSHPAARLWGGENHRAMRTRGVRLETIYPLLGCGHAFAYEPPRSLFVRILQNGTLLARLSAVKRQDDWFTALWHGPPPPFEPTEQVAPLVVESDDGLERRDCWLYSITAPTRGEGPLCVELGAERMPPVAAKEFRVRHGRACTRGSTKIKARDDILAVDDDPETLALVAEALEEQGFAVRRASSGREALATMAKTPPPLLSSI